MGVFQLAPSVRRRQARLPRPTPFLLRPSVRPSVRLTDLPVAAAEVFTRIARIPRTYAGFIYRHYTRRTTFAPHTLHKKIKFMQNTPPSCPPIHGRRRRLKYGTHTKTHISRLLPCSCSLPLRWLQPRQTSDCLVRLSGDDDDDDDDGERVV